MSEKVVFADGVREALDRCQAADNGPEAFVICHYTSKNVVDVAAEGKGFLSAALEKLDRNEIGYILLRKDWQVELARTTKLVFVDYTPDSLPPTRKALVSTHKGQVSDFMKPFHTDHLASDFDDLAAAEEDILVKIGAAAGTHKFETKEKAWTHLSKKMEASSAPQQQQQEQDETTPAEPQRKFCGDCGSALNFRGSCPQCNPVQQQPRSSGVGAGKGKLNIPEEVRDAIARVHRDDHENVWTVIGYVHRDGFEVLAEGAGEVVTDTVLENMPDDNISLALIRVVDYVDNHPTVKFVFIQSMPDTVSVMKRSRVATQKNLIHPIFEPYHVMFEISEKSDINHEILMDKVQAASGTKKWEVEKRD